MTLIVADRLIREKFFSAGGAVPQGSSFDLTIGCIFDHEGKKVDGPFNLKPGHIVQVASAEVFRLPPNITGHVTYKTTLTQKGIWALTVGIVDPGWNGPVSTTLLNFSRADYPLTVGDPFLRVSFFEHDPVSLTKLRTTPSLEEYNKNVQKAAAALFPPTFLNSEAIAIDAGKRVMEQVRNQALAWIAGVAIIFTICQFVADFASFKFSEAATPSQEDVQVLRSEIESLKSEITKLRAIPTKLLTSPSTGKNPADTPSHILPSSK